MRKIIFILSAVFVLSTVSASAQEVATKSTAVKAKTKKAKKIKAGAYPKIEGVGMLFDSETIDYGTVPANSDGKREFTFVNNGTQPLIITNAAGSCGCTVPTFPKEPIMPGARAVIGVKYDTSRAGQPFSKNVTITSNAKDMPSKVLTIKGTVSPLPSPEAPKS